MLTRTRSRLCRNKGPPKYWVTVPIFVSALVLYRPHVTGHFVRFRADVASDCVRPPADRLFHHDFGILSTMHTDNGNELEPTIFSATLTPHRSLGRSGFLIVMILFGLASFITGMLFLVLGAWPVFGFCGLDALLLYWAFRLNYRHAEAYEQVTVTCSELRVRKVSHLGGVREWVLNPLWVKLDKIEIEDFGINRLFLVSRGKKLSIASFLSPDEKADFAREL